MAAKLRSEAVYEAVRAEIIRGQLAPGERLAIRGLAQRFGVSDMPTREAIWMLTRDGLIDSTPYRGARVRTFTRSELREAYEVRGHLESLAIRLGSGRLGKEQRHNVCATMADLQAALDADDFVNFGAMNRVFHESILAGCSNGRLISLIGSLWDNQVAFQTVFRLDPSRARDSQAEHKAIVEAVFDGDGKRASRLIIDHRQHGAAALSATALIRDKDV